MSGKPRPEPDVELVDVLASLFCGVNAKMSLERGGVATGIGYHNLRRRCLGEVALRADEIPAICLTTNDRQLLDVLERQSGFCRADIQDSDASMLERRCTEMGIALGQLQEATLSAIDDGVVASPEAMRLLAIAVRLRDDADRLVASLQARVSLRHQDEDVREVRRGGGYRRG